MTGKSELINNIEKKEKKLNAAEQEMSVWNNGKYKTSSNAEISKIYVAALRKEIEALKAELKVL